MAILKKLFPMDALSTAGARPRRLSNYWIIPLGLTFIFGGALQYAGIISPTQTSLLSCLLFIPIFRYKSSWRKFSKEFLIVLFSLYVVASGIVQATKIEYSLIYIFYALSTILAATTGRYFANGIRSRNDVANLTRLIKRFLILNLIITAFQAAFTEQFVAFARVPIGYEDAIFGTLQLQTDSTLAAICAAIVVCFSTLPVPHKDRLLINTLAVGIIYFGNSKAAQIYIVVVMLLCYWSRIWGGMKFKKGGIKLVVLALFIIMMVFYWDALLNLVRIFAEQAESEYVGREQNQTAGRFAPFGQLLFNEYNLYGFGALTYYNPITKEWLYNAGFSSFYILFIDFGLPGLLLITAYYCLLIIRFRLGWIKTGCFFLIFLSFSAFNFNLGNIAFTLSFVFLLQMTANYGRSAQRD